MPRHPRGAVALRGICVLFSVYLSAALAWYELARPVAARSLAQMTFEDALLSLCASALTVCAGWLAIAATVVVAEAVANPVDDDPRGTLGSRICPLPIRRTILVGCGAALSAGLAAPALAEAPGSADHHPAVVRTAAIAGLAVPDRAIGAIRTATQTSPTAVTVRQGDSLWSIAEQSRRVGGTEAEVATAWRAIYANNLACIGANPDLIFPGSLLEMPKSLTTERKEVR